MTSLHHIRADDGLPELPAYGGSRAAGPLYPTVQRFALSEEGRRSVRPAVAAQMLGVTRPLIYQLMNAGELASFRIGHARLITVASIEALIARRLEAEQ